MVENILTLGKVLSLWFCFFLHSILFVFISQTSYLAYKIISSCEPACPVMGTIFLVYFPRADASGKQLINAYELETLVCSLYYFETKY